jgi:hypothetical protein
LKFQAVAAQVAFEKYFVSKANFGITGFSHISGSRAEKPGAFKSYGSAGFSSCSTAHPTREMVELSVLRFDADEFGVR